MEQTLRMIELHPTNQAIGSGGLVLLGPPRSLRASLNHAQRIGVDPASFLPDLRLTPPGARGMVLRGLTYRNRQLRVGFAVQDYWPTAVLTPAESDFINGGKRCVSALWFWRVPPLFSLPAF